MFTNQNGVWWPYDPFTAEKKNSPRRLTECFCGWKSPRHIQKHRQDMSYAKRFKVLTERHPYAQTPSHVLTKR